MHLFDNLIQERRDGSRLNRAPPCPRSLQETISTPLLYINDKIIISLKSFGLASNRGWSNNTSLGAAGRSGEIPVDNWSTESSGDTITRR